MSVCHNVAGIWGEMYWTALSTGRRIWAVPVPAVVPVPEVLLPCHKLSTGPLAVPVQAAVLLPCPCHKLSTGPSSSSASASASSAVDLSQAIHRSRLRNFKDSGIIYYSRCNKRKEFSKRCCWKNLSSWAIYITKPTLTCETIWIPFLRVTIFY